MHSDELDDISIHVELKPCPFCGGKAFTYAVEAHKHLWTTSMDDHLGSGYVECTRCTAVVSGESKADAINNWNRRDGT